MKFISIRVLSIHTMQCVLIASSFFQFPTLPPPSVSLNPSNASDLLFGAGKPTTTAATPGNMAVDIAGMLASATANSGAGGAAPAPQQVLPKQEVPSITFQIRYEWEYSNGCVSVFTPFSLPESLSLTVACNDDVIVA